MLKVQIYLRLGMGKHRKVLWKGNIVRVEPDVVVTESFTTARATDKPSLKKKGRHKRKPKKNQTTRVTWEP